MSHIYKNITGTTAVTLITKEGASNVTSLNICNTKSSGAIKVDLYINYSSTSDSLERIETERNFLLDHGGEMLEPLDPTIFKYCIIKNVEVPFGTSLFLEKNELAYDTSKYDLYIALDADSSTADIILSTDMSVSTSTTTVTATDSSSSDSSSSSSSSGSGSGY